jgi:hypothetical protein
VGLQSAADWFAHQPSATPGTLIMSPARIPPMKSDPTSPPGTTTAPSVFRGDRADSPSSPPIIRRRRQLRIRSAFHTGGFLSACKFPDFRITARAAVTTGIQKSEISFLSISSQSVSDPISHSK